MSQNNKENVHISTSNFREHPISWEELKKLMETKDYDTLLRSKKDQIYYANEMKKRDKIYHSVLDQILFEYVFLCI